MQSKGLFLDTTYIENAIASSGKTYSETPVCLWYRDCKDTVYYKINVCVFPTYV